MVPLSCGRKRPELGGDECTRNVCNWKVSDVTLKSHTSPSPKDQTFDFVTFFLFQILKIYLVVPVLTHLEPRYRKGL